MELKKENAKEIYEHVPDGFKKRLEAEFGPETFRKISFKDIKTFEDVCKACGTTVAEFEAKWKKLALSQTLKTVAKFELLSEAINQGWKPDTLDTNQRKWFPVFDVSSSGLAFSASRYRCDTAYADACFPFCFESQEQSDHAGRVFVALWEELILRKTA